MITFLIFALCLFSLLGAIDSANENDLPVYLRGIGWRNVVVELRKDLRLSKSVRPSYYYLNLDVAVSGYNNAQKSTFNGTVTIIASVTAPVKKIELHSLGLTIRKAKMLGFHTSEEEWETLDIGKFQMRSERETIVIPSKRLLLPGEVIALEIEYNGTARKDGSGFYESWNEREDSSDLPYISLLTHCEPSRARRWFPCFDEPDMKAMFQLNVTHPENTNAYSNTRVLSTSTNNGTRSTQFGYTRPLPTYLFALAITEQPLVELTVDGYEFRAIGHNREKAVRTAAKAVVNLRNHSIFEGVDFIPEKTDILIVDDYRNIALENPGLITIDFKHSAHFSMQTHELAHMYFGNLVTLSTWGDIWLNEGFAALFEKNLRPSSTLVDRSKEVISLHDLPLHSDHSYYSSIHLHNSFEAHIQHIHYERASQFIRMLRKFIGAEVFDRAINKYLRTNSYRNADAANAIKQLLQECTGDCVQLKKMLYEWIYQPGIAVLFMQRHDDRVVLTQNRFTSTFFDETLRDEHTRFTIPLFCEIDGEQRTVVFDSGAVSLSIPLSANSTFTIENDYGELFGIWASPIDFPDLFDNIDDWLLLTENLFRSEMIDIGSYSETISSLAGDRSVKKYLHSRLFKEEGSKLDARTDRPAECELVKGEVPLPSIFTEYLRKNDLSVLFCFIETSDRETVKGLLHDKIITDELKIRSIQLEDVIKTMERSHPGAAMEFAMEELQIDPSSLPLRLRMKDIISAVYSTSNDISTLHEFILLHPFIAAESSDIILQILEKKYIQEELEGKDRILCDRIKRIL